MEIKKDRLVYLDAFRGISALWVLVYHFNHYYTKDYVKPIWVQNILENGYLGVAFFFVISAFSMGLSSDRHKEGSVLYFYIRRFFRIAPLYYVILAIGITFLYRIYSYSGLALNLIFAYNFFERHYAGMVWAGWTIGIEMPFYLIFPFIWKGIGKFKEWGFLVFTLLSSIIVYYHYWAFKDVDNGVFWVLSFFRFFLVFIMGIWVYLISKKLQGAKHANLIGNTLFVVGLSLLILMIFNFYKPEFRYESFYSGFFFSLILLGASISSFNSVFDHKILKWLGKNSYSIYLIHTIVINKFDSYIYAFLKYRTQSIEIAFYSTMIFTVVVTCFLSEVAWRLIEKPGIDLGNKLVKKLKARTAPITS
jgi:peptidoglycan/LPS O-acetylase OafA/YrhL